MKKYNKWLTCLLRCWAQVSYIWSPRWRDLGATPGTSEHSAAPSKTNHPAALASSVPTWSPCRAACNQFVIIPDICHLDHLYIGGENIGHVERFLISTHDRCGEI